MKNKFSNWIIMPFSALIEDFQNGFASGERDDNGIIQLRMNNVNSTGKMIMDKYIRVPPKYYSSKYDIKQDDILFNHTNSAEMVGKSFVFNGYGEPITFSNHFSRIRVNESLVNPKFIVFYLVNLFNQRFFEKFCDRWIHQAAFQKEKLLKLQVYFPRLKYQNRIVQIIETQLNAVEEAKKAIIYQLKFAERLLDSYIATEYNAKTYRNVTLDKISLINPSTKGKIPKDNFMEVSFIPMNAVDANTGNIVSAEIKPLQEVRKGYTFFENNDILFAKITPCMQNGKHTIAKDLKNGIGFGSTEFHVIKPSVDVLPEWIHYFIRQPKYLSNAENYMQGAVGQQRLPDDFLRSTIIPLPPLKEQKEIISSLNSQNIKTATLKKCLFDQLSYIEALSSSILRQAFMGEL